MKQLPYFTIENNPIYYKRRKNVFIINEDGISETTYNDNTDDYPKKEDYWVATIRFKNNKIIEFDSNDVVRDITDGYYHLYSGTTGESTSEIKIKQKYVKQFEQLLNDCGLIKYKNNTGVK